VTDREGENVTLMFVIRIHAVKGSVPLDGASAPREGVQAKQRSGRVDAPAAKKL